MGQTLASMGSFTIQEGLYGSGDEIGDPGENLPNAHNAGIIIEVTDHAKGARCITYSGGPKASSTTARCWRCGARAVLTGGGARWRQ